MEAQIKQTAPVTVAYKSMHGPYSQIPDGYRSLYEWIEHYGLQPTGMPEAIFLTRPDITPESDAEYELWAPIAGGAGKTSPEEDGIGVKRVEPETVASAMHKGSYDAVAEVYQELNEWVGIHGYEVVGPPREVYYNGPGDVPPSEYVTEVQFPVAKA